jgi:protein-tyrosine phosphatase
MVRQVILPSWIKGRMYIHHMPGRYSEPLDDFIRKCKELGINRVVCLTPMREIEVKSPEYAKAINEGTLPWITEFFPIQDFGNPADPDEFLSFCLMQAAYLVRGEAILIHCGAGVGRTSTCAAVILMILGFSFRDALSILAHLGSQPDTREQGDLVNCCARNLNR